MGYKEFDLTVPPGFTGEDLKKILQKRSGLEDFTYSIQKKSLDARKKKEIIWKMRVAVCSDAYTDELPGVPTLEIPKGKHDEKILVTGSGPAGFFAAFVLQKAGFQVTLIERGSDVESRSRGIKAFEAGGEFNPKANYAFGEGGAGTFSDGKLTSRSKHIKPERNFIIESYIAAGAPEEIRYLAHPHLGTDNLKKIVKRLRRQFTELGGTMLFETQLLDIEVKDGKIASVETTNGTLDVDYLYIATGHSSYDTYRMLMRKGVPFQHKNFALGYRVEHAQKWINQAQWGRETLPGVKAAEYRLTTQNDPNHPVYTFCMCPGGTIVPAAAYPGQNIVNGMSMYDRGGEFANAACVAGVQIEKLLGKEVSPLEALDWLESLEQKFFAVSSDYKAPAVSIRSFLNKKLHGVTPKSSYALGLEEFPIWTLLPPSVVTALQTGLQNFSRKVKGYEYGTLMGLENKSSAPIQVLREKNGQVEGFENLFVIGEGSGYAGGIISSAADGVRSAISLVSKLS